MLLVALFIALIEMTLTRFSCKEAGNFLSTASITSIESTRETHTIPCMYVRHLSIKTESFVKLL